MGAAAMGAGLFLSAAGSASSAKNQQKQAQRMAKQQTAWQAPFSDVAKMLSSQFQGAMQGGTMSPIGGAYTPYDAMARGAIEKMQSLDPRTAIALANQYIEGTQAANLLNLGKAKQQTADQLGGQFGIRVGGPLLERQSQLDQEFALQNAAQAFNYALPLYNADVTRQGALMQALLGAAQQDKWTPYMGALQFATAHGPSPNDYGQGISPMGVGLSNLGSALASYPLLTAQYQNAMIPAYVPSAAQPSSAYSQTGGVYNWNPNTWYATGQALNR